MTMIPNEFLVIRHHFRKSTPHEKAAIMAWNKDGMRIAYIVSPNAKTKKIVN